MKYILMAWLCLSAYAGQDWLTDWNKASETAKKQQKLVLLNFSGSDWCAPCIRLKKEIFQSPAFNEIASNSLVLVNADFPRNKKNQLSKEQQRHNEELAERYNSSGKFPYTVLLTPDGTVVQEWDGFPSGGEAAFLEELKKKCTQQTLK